MPLIVPYSSDLAGAASGNSDYCIRPHCRATVAIMRYRTLGIVAFGLGSFACEPANEDRPLTYQEFVGLAYVEPETGVYVINGDELAETEADLQAAYARYLHDQLPDGVLQEPLIVNQT